MAKVMLATLLLHENLLWLTWSLQLLQAGASCTMQLRLDLRSALMYCWKARALMSGLRMRRACCPCTMRPSMHSPCVPTTWQRQLQRHACRRTVQVRRQQMQQRNATRARYFLHTVLSMPGVVLSVALLDTTLCCLPLMYLNRVCAIQVLNAMLLACASISSEEAVTSMARLLQAGAVPDTWAPNGSSVCAGTPPLCFGKNQHGVQLTGKRRRHERPLMMLLVQALMLAASVDCTEGLSLLIEHGATIELQVLSFIRLLNVAADVYSIPSGLHRHLHV